MVAVASRSSEVVQQQEDEEEDAVPHFRLSVNTAPELQHLQIASLVALAILEYATPIEAIRSCFVHLEALNQNV
jgi:hypothetical protein